MFFYLTPSLSLSANGTEIPRFNVTVTNADSSPLTFDIGVYCEVFSARYSSMNVFSPDGRIVAINSIGTWILVLDGDPAVDPASAWRAQDISTSLGPAFQAFVGGGAASSFTGLPSISFSWAGLTLPPGGERVLRFAMRSGYSPPARTPWPTDVPTGLPEGPPTSLDKVALACTLVALAGLAGTGALIIWMLETKALFE
jgi:hypothetical protein